jgi:hypothetical protein
MAHLAQENAANDVAGWQPSRAAAFIPSDGFPLLEKCPRTDADRVRKNFQGPLIRIDDEHAATAVHD